MRALTVRQPWADLIMAGVKPVENRTWKVPSTVGGWGFACKCGKYPFRLGIHAAATVEPKRSPLWRRGGLPHDDMGIGLEWSRWASLFAPHARQSSPLADRLGALLGTVEVTGCHHADECEHEHGDTTAYSYCSRWAEPDVHHWTLTDPQPLPKPIPMRGSQGLWRLEFEEVAPA